MPAVNDPFIFNRETKVIDPTTGRPWQFSEGVEPGYDLPHVWTFSSIIGAAWRQYYQGQQDDALANDPEFAIAMERDPLVMSIVQERCKATVNRDWDIKVDNDRDPAQKALANGLKQIVNKIPHKRQLFSYMLEGAIWAGRVASELKYIPKQMSLPSWQNPDQKVRVEIPCPVGHQPIDGDKLNWTYDGIPTIQIYNPKASSIPNSAVIAGTASRSIALLGSWRNKFIIHSHEVRDAPYWMAWRASSIYGLGVRHYIYWLAWLKRELLANILTYAERTGMGLRIWKYQAGNTQSKAEVKEAAENQTDRTNLLLPVTMTPGGRPVEGVEFVESGSTIATLLMDILRKFDDDIERFIIGQSMSSGVEATGLGSEGIAGFQEACVPVETSEILTRRGFKNAHDVQIGEEVLSYDVDDDSCKWVPLLGKIFYDDSPITRMTLSRKKMDIVCTPNHSWAVEVGDGYASAWHGDLPKDSVFTTGPRGGLRRQSPRTLKKTCEIKRRDNIILAAAESEQFGSLLTPVESAILGWMITDGTVKRVGNSVRIGICQSNERYFPRIRELVGSAKELVSAPQERTFPMSGRTYKTKSQHWWYLPSSASKSLLEKSGFKSRADLPGIVTKLNFLARESMLEAMMDGDGDNKKTFYNTDPYVIEAYEILCALQGIATGESIVKEKDGYKPITRKRQKKGRLAYGQYIQFEESGVADVWCPTTKYGTWVMRQNGRVLITGNTKANLCEYDADNFGETMTTDLVRKLGLWSYPKELVEDADPKFAFQVAPPSAEKVMAVNRSYFDMGGKINGEKLREVTTIPAPKPGDEVLSFIALQEAQTKLQTEAAGQQAQQQAAMGMQPGGEAGGEAGAEQEPSDEDYGGVMQQLLGDQSKNARDGVPMRYAAPGNASVPFTPQESNHLARHHAALLHHHLGESAPLALHHLMQRLKTDPQSAKLHAAASSIRDALEPNEDDHEEVRSRILGSQRHNGHPARFSMPGIIRDLDVAEKARNPAGPMKLPHEDIAHDAMRMLGDDAHEKAKEVESDLDDEAEADYLRHYPRIVAGRVAKHIRSKRLAMR